VDKVSKTTNEASKPLGFPHLLFFFSELQNSHKNMLLSIFVMFKQLQLFSEKKNKRSAFQMLERMG
jgi:hypothetical protein